VFHTASFVILISLAEFLSKRMIKSREKKQRRKERSREKGRKEREKEGKERGEEGVKRRKIRLTQEPHFSGS
jgi:hypothetical protein